VINFFRNLQISSTSFFLGFLSGILFAWILLGLRVYLPKVIRASRHKFADLRENFSTGAEVRLRNDIYRFTQKQHIAASLFSLNEIVIEPKVLTPLIQSSSSIDSALTDSVSLTVPYIPDWPELAAVYNASTMTLLDALQGGANIILAGHPGCGKTVALAWLSALIARNDKGLGRLADLLPLYIHATDIPHLLYQPENAANATENVEEITTVILEKQRISKVKNSNEVVDLLIQSISSYVSPLTLNGLPRVIHSALENQHALLLLDRVDELPPTQARIITEYLGILLEKYPKLRIIVAMSYDDLAGLPSLGFSLLGMAAWGDAERSSALQRWSLQWAKWIMPAGKSHSKYIHSHFLNSWLSANNSFLTTLEYTLKVWAAFSGDILGTDGPSAIEAYVRRMTYNKSDGRLALEQFALQLLIEISSISNPLETDRLISGFTTESNSFNSTDNADQEELSQPSPKIIPQNKNIPGIDTLTNNGFLISYPGSRYGFSHPVFFGYLAGKALSESGVLSQFQLQPSWMGKNITMYYLSRYGDVTSLIQHYLQEDDILHTNHFLISRWLQVAPKNRSWRTIILRTLASILQKERDTISLAAKILSAMAFSGDEGVSIYFRQLLKSDHPNLKILAALGCGILADKNATEDLYQILQEPSPASMRSASLALAAIGDKKSLEILAANLLSGSDLIRRYAAEALANSPTEGHPALKEGSGMEDLLVRRSVVFGLIRVDLPWARKIIEDLQLEDNEWVVRNAAIQAFDELQKKINNAPSPFTDLAETQWLIDYAIRNGTTVAPGNPAEDLVRKALTTGTQEEKLLAMDFFRFKCDRKSIETIYSTYKNSTGELRDASYYILWLMKLAGLRLPLSFE
jgi:hypothetical protein